MNVLDGIRDALGGGNLTLWLVVGGVVAAWLAIKAAKLALKVILLAAGGAMLLATAPWSGQALEGPAADCAAAIVAESSTGWETNITKRVTVELLSEDAACTGDTGLSAGRAIVKLRTFYDIPFQTWDVTPDGAVARNDLPDLPDINLSDLPTFPG